MNNTAPSKGGIKINFKSHATTGFPAWRLRNERINSMLTVRHNPDLRSASDWSHHVGNLLQPIRSTTKIWEVKGNLEFHRSFLRHHFGGKPVVASQHVAWIVFSGYDYGRRLATVQVKVYITNQYKKQGSKVQSKSVLQLVLGESCS